MVIDSRFVQATTMFCFFLKWLAFSKQFQAKPSKWFCVTRCVRLMLHRNLSKKKAMFGLIQKWVKKCLDHQRACPLYFLTFLLFCCASDVSARRQFPKDSWLLIPPVIKYRYFGLTSHQAKVWVFHNPTIDCLSPENFQTATSKSSKVSLWNVLK